MLGEEKYTALNILLQIPQIRQYCFLYQKQSLHAILIQRKEHSLKSLINYRTRPSWQKTLRRQLELHHSIENNYSIPFVHQYNLQFTELDFMQAPLSEYGSKAEQVFFWSGDYGWSYCQLNTFASISSWVSKQFQLNNVREC